jgi:hypothetical protein
MLEREATRKYLIEFGSSMALYLAVLAVSLFIAKDMAPGIARTLLLVAPLVPILLIVWAIARQFRRLDEFMRLRTLESLAIAAAVTAGVTFTYGFLENAGFPRLSMFWVWGVMGFVWGAHSCLRSVFTK